MARPKTREEIAAAMNITPDEVRRIQERAMAKALPRLEALLVSQGAAPDARLIDFIALLGRGED